MTGPALTVADLWVLLLVTLGVLVVVFAFLMAIEFCQAPYAELEEPPPVHACPPAGSGLMPCCGRTPLEVPRGERVTSYGPMVTCDGAR